MNDEIFVLLGLTIITVGFLAMVWMILQYKKDRQDSRSEQPTLTASELQRIVQRAVEDANRPLLERMDRLEADTVGRREQLASHSAPRLGP